PVVTDTSITCNMPAGQGATVQFRVTRSVPAPSDVSALFTWGGYDDPILSGIIPSAGSTAGNYPIVITGSNFGLNRTVYVNGTALSPSLVSGNHTTVTVSQFIPGLWSIPIQISVSGRTAATPLNFDYLPPQIDSLNPSNGPTDGRQILIMG